MSRDVMEIQQKGSKILICFGTRPEYIKLLPVIKELERKEIPFKILFTGQHQDAKFEYTDYKITMYDKFYRLPSIVSDIMIHAPYIIDKFDVIIVQGDTSSALACALTAFYMNKTVIHVEAGVRTNNLHEPFPEEANRRLISQIATYHFCPTYDDSYNLMDQEHTFVVGNTVLDHLKDIETSYSDKIVVMLHRRENEKMIPAFLEAIDDWAYYNRDIRVVAVKSPNPAMNRGFKDLTSTIVKEPMDYKEFIKLLSEARFIITDSGGILDEAMFLGKKVILTRIASSSRVPYLGRYIYEALDECQLVQCVNRISRNFTIESCRAFGHGDSGEQIVKILQEHQVI